MPLSVYGGAIVLLNDVCHYVYCPLVYQSSGEGGRSIRHYRAKLTSSSKAEGAGWHDRGLEVAEGFG